MKSPESKRQRALRKARRLAIAAAVGSSLGAICTFLPPQYHMICTLAAKVIGLVVGGS